MNTTLQATPVATPAVTDDQFTKENWRVLQDDLRQLECERDALADEVGQTFEELHCLRRLASSLASCTASQDVGAFANDFLPALRDIVRAEAVYLLMGSSSRRSGANVTGPMTVLQAGTCCLSHEELDQLDDQLRSGGPDESVVFNRGSQCQRRELKTSASNLVAVPLAHQTVRYGWLIAVNRLASEREEQPTDLNCDEFGTRDVVLFETAATMLAGHLRNAELFRAEERLRVGVIETITGAIDARDPYTCGHSRRVAEFAVQIAERMGYTPDQCERLYITGLLHDVGKIGVPDAILGKPDRLTDEEFDVIKQHPTIGHTILTPLEALAFTLPGVLHHHERMDGKGYPHGLCETDIPLDARILAVADSYDAMTSDRAYRPGMPKERAIGILKECAGQQWDRDAVAAFLAVQETA